MADTPVRIGIIGVGGMARSHINNLLGIEGVEIVALADTVPQQMERAQERFPALAGAFITQDYRQLLARDDADAVVIATPHTLHTEQALDAIAAGKHILLEKPMVCSVADAQTLLARLEGYPRVFGLGYQRHAQGPFLHMRERIASGELGQVTFMNALQCQQWKRGTVGKWRQDPALSGGGQLNDSGSHLLDILLWMTDLTVAEVSAFIDNCGTPVDINSAISVRFTSGAQGNISVIGDAPTWHEDMTIWCERGVFFYRNGRLEFSDETGKRRTLEEADLPPGETIDENFVRAVRGQTGPAAPPISGLRTIELTEAAWKSAAQNGQPVKMN